MKNVQIRILQHRPTNEHGQRKVQYQGQSQSKCSQGTSSYFFAYYLTYSLSLLQESCRVFHLQFKSTRELKLKLSNPVMHSVCHCLVLCQPTFFKVDIQIDLYLPWHEQWAKQGENKFYFVQILHTSTYKVKNMVDLYFVTN